MVVQIRQAIGKVPGIKPIAAGVRRRQFPGSANYWESRYASGGNSGAGSYGVLAEYKAQVLNDLVAEFGIQSVLELGCGDGAQLQLARYPNYVGLDVSSTVLKACVARFAGDDSKSFFLYDGACFVDRQGIFAADLALSLDVVYHLVEDEIFNTHMCHLFDSAQRMVAIYASDHDEGTNAAHVRHRSHSAWVVENAPGWRLMRTIPNPYSAQQTHDGSFAFFSIYSRES